MGLDGFSISSVGLDKNKTSSNLALEAELLALQTSMSQVKTIDGLAKKQKPMRKDEEASFGGGYLPDTTEEDEEKSEPKKVKIKKIPEINEEELKKYHFRLNTELMIEIYDNETNEVIRSINPEDAAKVLMNIRSAPSVIFNDKV